MGVFSWFRRRAAEAPPSGAADGGSVAVLTAPQRSAPEPTEGAEQESPPGVPAARSAPEAESDPVESVVASALAVVNAGSAEVGTAESDETGTAGVPAPPVLAPDVAELLAAALAAASQGVEPAGDAQPQSRPERPDTGDEAMGLMDNLKGKAEELAGELKEKASHLAGQHNEKIDEFVDKAGDALDKATKGKYSDKIATGTEKTKDAVDGFAEKPGSPQPADPAGPADGSGGTAAPSPEGNGGPQA
ncbi:Rv0909 family putative TA system antitoxin [Kitasatospora sp. NBC_01250]|uniref:antitoxin n=1 Tax=Kitasatospora sp. NBC_01250 TaxID=2903571 RepID=UPI002E34B647|nr:Rv0909 family putative TA system antitoxin [Kitasatospora sp. NBC_01250]